MAKAQWRNCHHADEDTPLAGEDDKNALIITKKQEVRFNNQGTISSNDQEIIKLVINW